jgi:hypothetical protein
VQKDEVVDPASFVNDLRNIFPEYKLRRHEDAQEFFVRLTDVTSFILNMFIVVS